MWVTSPPPSSERRSPLASVGRKIGSVLLGRLSPPGGGSPEFQLPKNRDGRNSQVSSTLECVFACMRRRNRVFRVPRSFQAWENGCGRRSPQLPAETVFPSAPIGGMPRKFASPTSPESDTTFFFSTMSYYMCMAANSFSRLTLSLKRGTSHSHRLKHEPIAPTSHTFTLFSRLPVRGSRDLWSRSLFVSVSHIPASFLRGPVCRPPCFLRLCVSLSVSSCAAERVCSTALRNLFSPL